MISPINALGMEYLDIGVGGVLLSILCVHALL